MIDSPVSGSMPRGTRTTLALICTIVLATTLGLAATSASGTARAAKAGDRAGDWKLKDAKGKRLALKDLRGKIVVLDFWASWCVPCKKELPVLDRMAKTYADAGASVAVVAINIDKDRGKADRFLKSAGISGLRVLFDPSSTSAGLYDLPTMPTSFVIDGKGIIRHVHAGFRPGDEQGLRREVDALLATSR